VITATLKEPPEQPTVKHYRAWTDMDGGEKWAADEKRWSYIGFFLFVIVMPLLFYTCDTEEDHYDDERREFSYPY
tara:strand:- start:201 stop:425 length:225 start_codon:yes stop_codon:yes gene_type:complete